MGTLEQDGVGGTGAPSPDLLEKVHAARAAWPLLASSLTATKDRILLDMAGRLRRATAEIVATNATDVEACAAQGASRAMADRLTLTEARIEAMARSLEEVAALRDPLGEGETWVRPNGLHLARVRVPLGVIGIIYEARPNVTVEAASLAFKAGNAVLLRGSSTALATNLVLVRLMQEALEEGGARSFPHQPGRGCASGGHRRDGPSQRTAGCGRATGRPGPHPPRGRESHRARD